ncbi:MAG: sensor histidine kinase [Symbiobacteriaceae bacterium]|jgi:NarL family two-component system sensor histidine kinase YdfH|nr:sensor histidine kinase [Symbiobacteriaceae bacterium]
MRKRDQTRIFFILTSAFLAFVWFMVVREPAFRDGGRLIPFTVTMAVHAYLHTTIGRWSGRIKAPVYLAAQTVLAVAVVVLGDGSMMTASLFFPLAGEVFGLFAEVLPRLLGMGALMAAWATTQLATAGWGIVRTQLPGAVLALAFVGIYVTLFTRQLRERERAEHLLAELEQVNGKLRAYALKVEELTITQERQRMARELHDTLAQGLAGLIMQLEAVDDLLARGDAERARAVTARAMGRARTTLQESRTAIQALRTPLERGDVMEAVRRLIDALAADTGITCTLEAGPGALDLPAQSIDTVYRVVQEALVNVAKHSQARRAWVRVAAETEGEVRLEVGDDGVGFDPGALQAGHFGLTGLRERVGLVGGRIAVESAPGQGTRILATLPAPGAGPAALPDKEA